MTSRPISRPLLALHGLAGLMVTALGLTYLSRASIMPYHLDAIGTTWDGLEPAYRALFLGFFKGVGAGYLSAGIALLILVVGPMRRGDRWTLWASPAITLAGMVPLTGIILYIGARTPAEPPLIYPLVVIALSMLGAFIALGQRLTRPSP